MQNNIKTLREAAEFTQEQLGAKCDPAIPGIYISRYEKQPGQKGYVRMPDHLKPQLANALGVPVSALFTYENEMDDSAGKPWKTENMTYLKPSKQTMRAMVPIVGYVMAGARIEVFNGSESELDLVPCPPNMDPSKTKVYEGLGDPGEPMFYAGWLFYREEVYPGVPVDFIGRICMVKVKEDENDIGNTLIKKIMRGTKPGHYDLHSINPSEPVIRDAWVESSSFIRMMEQRG